MLWAFHNVLKYPLLFLFPIKHQSSLYPIAGSFLFFQASKFFLILVSLFIGAVTHIIWDSFTHEFGWAVQKFQILNSPVIITSYGTVKLHSILQHGSTIIGAILLLYWYLKWVKSAPGVNIDPRFKYPGNKKLIFIICISLLACFMGILYSSSKVVVINSITSFRYFFVNSIIAIISSLFLLIFIYSIFWHLIISKAWSRIE
jgi:hypothetical protein